MLPEPFRAMDPDDEVGWHAVADWLEDHGQADRAELVRLTRLLRHGPQVPEREKHEDRLRELMNAGVAPCVATLSNSIGMQFAYVPSGMFLMGSPDEEPGHAEEEGPVHEVIIERGFYLGTFPVTQAEYQAVMGKNPSQFSSRGQCKERVDGLDTSRYPVENLSHQAALAFCRRLTAEEKREGRVYRLPTEAEWEYACRAGGGSKPYSFGDDLSTDRANVRGSFNDAFSTALAHSLSGDLVAALACVGKTAGKPTEVGRYPPNAFGLYDMHGNVWEWCADWYRRDYYSTSPLVDPRGPSVVTDQVFRGGSWYDSATSSRSAYRGRCQPSMRSFHLGFRVVLVASNE